MTLCVRVGSVWVSAVAAPVPGRNGAWDGLWYVFDAPPLGAKGEGAEAIASGYIGSFSIKDAALQAAREAGRQRAREIAS
jgi:hypothetical protein